MEAAFGQLAQLGPDGIQLTPGNLPTPGFEPFVQQSGLEIATHHGFAFRARRQDVWIRGQCIVDAGSVHPERSSRSDLSIAEWLAAQSRPLPVLETMYPGYFLGNSAELHLAMSLGLELALDVSHVFIQLEQGALDSATWRRLAEYPHIAEIHLSRNGGRHDSHWPITTDTFGLEWAQERARDGTPIVLESYFHKLSEAERRRQLDLARGRS